MIGEEEDPYNTCRQYKELNNGNTLSWSVDRGNEGLKEHVLCCMPQELVEIEDALSDSISPIWFDRKHGWKGGSHEDANNYCDGLGGMELCPYSAYCPHGPGEQPRGMRQFDSNLKGEQWAPVRASDGNVWVLIGVKYNNTAT